MEPAERSLFLDAHIIISIKKERERAKDLRTINDHHKKGLKHSENPAPAGARALWMARDELSKYRALGQFMNDLNTEIRPTASTGEATTHYPGLWHLK